VFIVYGDNRVLLQDRLWLHAGHVNRYDPDKAEQTHNFRRREILPRRPEVKPESYLYSVEDRCDCRVYTLRYALGIHIHVRHHCRCHTPPCRAVIFFFYSWFTTDPVRDGTDFLTNEALSIKKARREETASDRVYSTTVTVPCMVG